MHNYISRTAAYFVLSACISACISCSAPKPKEISFRAEWKQVFENTIAGNIDETTVSIVTDGKRFKIADKHTVKVYDGTNLYTKTKEIPMDDLFGDFGINQEFPETRERSITKIEAQQYMFWTKTQGKKQGPGGSIAGQETTLYQLGFRRPDSEVKLQNWVDAETGILLKSIHTIYSSQIEQMVSKDMSECTFIEYGYVDEENFNRP